MNESVGSRVEAWMGWNGQFEAYQIDKRAERSYLMRDMADVGSGKKEYQALMGHPIAGNTNEAEDHAAETDLTPK